MIQEEKFIFDLQGYLLIKGVLTPEEVAELNQVSDRVFPRDYNDGTGQREKYRNAANVSKWDPACQRLIDHPRIVPYLEELIGPHFRLDHDYSIFMDPGAQGGYLHGGPERDSGSHFFKHYDGTIRNGLSVLTFFLSDVGPGDGGFVCIPGSHKTNFLWELPDDVRHQERAAPYVKQPLAKSGDALLFTEALIHGTRLWKADHERRTFLYKYCPGNMSWASTYYDTNEYLNLTDQQRRILAPPSTGGREKSLD
jgi:ectoine hydroxylase-related dioxygenase (phytanoyl-CoA dioxygenase family)